MTKSTLFAFFAAIGVVMVPQVIAAPADLEARFNGNVYVCTDPNWGGDCENLEFTPEVCLNFPAPFQDSISSLGPDGGWTCTPYSDLGCSGDGFFLKYPGEPDLANSPYYYASDNQLSSIVCWWTG